MGAERQRMRGTFTEALPEQGYKMPAARPITPAVSWTFVRVAQRDGFQRKSQRRIPAAEAIA